MIVVYTSPGCASCRKVKQWLKDKQLPFVEKNIFSTILKENEIRNLLVRSENGTDDIISKRSKIIQEGNVDVDTMKTKELIQFIQQNPSILRRPIILNERSFLVGYDNEEIGMFVPPELRAMSFHTCNETCPNYESCGTYREDESCREQKTTI